MKIMLINGPNLNLLGQREVDIYGSKTLNEIENNLKNIANQENAELICFQSNSEGDIIDYIQKIGFESDGILLNAGAYTHTSVAIGDAIRAIDAPVIEVHISNTAAREDFRKKSLILSSCLGIVAGFGLDSYEMALRYFVING